MCNSLKLGKFESKIGERVRVQFNSKTTSKVWSGFARVDRVDWWKQKSSFVDVCVRATVITEGKVDLRVPGGQIVAIGLKKDVHVHGRMIARAQTVKLVTRAPMNPFEKQLNSRWPCVKDPKDPTRYYVWSHADVIKKQLEIPF